MTAVATTAAVRPKELHFPLSVEWIAGRRVAAQVEGKRTIEIAPPPVFHGTDATTWSPEDFFVAAAASCLAVTFAGLAATAGLWYAGLKVDGAASSASAATDASASRACSCDSRSRSARPTRCEPASLPRRRKRAASFPSRSTSPSRP
jgi:organic hydroperoxide reductase OsmC/OhrA